jgi:AcrR family transcriptional regulator
VGTKERREREKQERRRQILDCARKLFWENGFNGTTMPGIAEACELAPGTLYLYFPSKDALYVELLVEGYQPLLERLRKAAEAEEGTPRAQAEAVIDAFLGYARECPEYFDIIFFVLQREGSGARHALMDEEQLKRLESQEEACKAVAAEVLGRTANGISPDDAKPVVNAVWSMLAGVVFFWRKEGKGKYNEVAGHAKKLVLDALLGP